MYFKLQKKFFLKKVGKVIVFFFLVISFLFSKASFAVEGPKAAMLHGEFSGEEITFREEVIVPDNGADCGFIGLGIDRRDLDVLIGRADDKELREMIWEEIAGPILTGEYKPAGVDSILSFFDNNDEKASEVLRGFCCKKETYINYLKTLQNSKMWIGQKIMLAYAKVKDFSVRIWIRESAGSNNLILDNYYLGGSAQKIDLLYNFYHFNLLVIED